jgi:OOP family OmpA-OmpF porin
MPPTLLSFLESQLSGGVVSHVSAFLGETEVRVGTAALAGQQALLVAMTQKATSPQGAGELLAMLSRADGGSSVGHAASLLPGGGHLSELARLGAPLATALLGDNQPGVVEWLSSATGIGRDAAVTLLGLLAPLVLRGVSHHLTSTGSGVDASALVDLLSAQAPPLLANIPAGLARALDMANVGDFTRGARAGAYSSEASKDTGLEFLKWVLPLIAVATLAVYVFGRPVAVGEAGQPTDDTTPLTPLAATAAPIVPDSPASAPARPTAVTTDSSSTGLGRMVERTLPNRSSIRVPENGIESRLLAFISDRDQVVDSTTSFSFDRLEFDTASATLRPSSNVQLDAVAAILKAYPRVSLKIGGYTDNVGDEVANLRLSAARAESTRQALVTRGVAGRRIDTEGFGERFPVASNSTEQGRQRNRRIDVRVTRK